MLKNDGSYDTQSKHNDESSSNIKNTTVSAINGDRFILSDESDEEGKEDKINQTLMDSSSTSGQVTTATDSARDSAVPRHTEEMSYSTDAVGRNSTSMNIEHGDIRPKVKQKVKFLPNGEDKWKVPEIISKAGKNKGKYKDWLNIHLEDNTVESTDWKNSVQEWCEYKEDITEPCTNENQKEPEVEELVQKVKDLSLIDNDDDQKIILFAENNDTVLVENAKTGKEIKYIMNSHFVVKNVYLLDGYLQKSLWRVRK